MADIPDLKDRMLTPDEVESYSKIAIKYMVLRQKIIESYERGCKILNIIKLVIAAAFVVFTVYAIAISEHTGNRMGWLVLWIIVIFSNAIIFLITDYCKYLVSDKVIPYLEDDDQLEFGEYSIFVEDSELELEEEEEEENA